MQVDVSRTDQAEVDDKKVSNRVSQRRRRRTASIKKQLLQQADSLAKPHTTTLSRKQRREQRRTRIAKRGTASSSSLAVPPAATNPALGSQPTTVNLPTSAPPEPPASPPRPPQTASVTPAPWQKKRRIPRPQLAHFNDRVQGSHWDDIFTKLNPDEAQNDPTRAYATQALGYWQKAARSRGDHLVLSGVGKNGALGPQLP
ncbi:uncharacterized protein SPSC_02201 [Sporisorium scitamineum]|nr:uncharacterized protein SPSC_02201 [Sporisorium scitamineum]